MKEENERKIAYDCRYFLGDRPCVWHKTQGALCECEHYIPLIESLLILKLDAMGDVLRTTCLLPVIAKTWPEARITWITRPESVPLLERNPYITEVIPYGPDALVHLSTRTFDRVVNLDAGKPSSGMAAMAKAAKKVGYLLHERGYVCATNAAAEAWLRLGIFDDLKRANQRTYQDMMCDILGLPPDGMRYVLELTDTEKEQARGHLLSLGLDPNRTIIGIHTGAGGRWPRKQWGEEGFIALIPQLEEELGDETQILLFGGPPERDLNARIAEAVGGRVFDAGCDNSVRHFAALISLCSVVLCADSLAMHVALGTGRRVVVLFGPTSSPEIELFGLGEKVFAELGCLACYKSHCDVSPHCMDSISVDMVKDAVLRQLGVAREQGAGGRG